MSLPENTLLQGGKYKLIRFISSGGFGCTYEALHVMLNKRVAIKEFFVKDFCNRDEHTSQITVGTSSKKALVDHLYHKFLSEARALCQMRHEGIVHVSDVFEENGTAYYVMDYVEGKSLKEIVKTSGPIDEARALKYARQVCEALRYVHQRNCLHLDVKPGNVMIDSKDNAVLIDFGASKQYDSSDGENDSILTGKTPGYAPLEQMSNDVSKFMPATDIYALGATMYKILSGITPPSAPQIASGEHIAPLPSEVSANTKLAIAQAMRISKMDRPQSIDEFLAILEGREFKKSDPKKPADDETEIVTCDDETEIVTDTTSKADEGETIVEIDEVHEEPRQPVTPPTPPTPPSTPPTPPTPQPAQPLTPPKPQPKPVRQSWLQRNMWIVAGAAAALVTLVVGMLVMGKREPVTLIKVVDMEYTNAAGETFRYTGFCTPESIPNGQGKGRYDGGMGVYVGDYNMGLRHGHGTYTRGGKGEFVGEFENDNIVSGTFTGLDKSYYVGTFYDYDHPLDGTWYRADSVKLRDIKDGHRVEP